LTERPVLGHAGDARPPATASRKSSKISWTPGWRWVPRSRRTRPAAARSMFRTVQRSWQIQALAAANSRWRPPAAVL